MKQSSWYGIAVTQLAPFSEIYNISDEICQYWSSCLMQRFIPAIALSSTKSRPPLFTFETSRKPYTFQLTQYELTVFTIICGVKNSQ